MKLFECCHYCVAPKRHPGCHSQCKDYIEQKAVNDARNAVISNAKQQEESLKRYPRKKYKR